MTLIKKGKTKDVYKLENGNILLKFKDDLTGENGVFDPGANAVGLTIKGAGQGGLKLSEYFFRLINEASYPTHFVSADIGKAEMIVQPATMFGEGLEVICRFRAVGSFIRRYGMYVKEGQKLDGLVEMTLKDDERGDPVITKEALDMLNILSGEEYEVIKKLTKDISQLIKDDLQKKGLELYDIKLEFGRVDGKIVLIDEISGGNMRVYKYEKIVDPMDLVNMVINAKQ